MASAGNLAGSNAWECTVQVSPEARALFRSLKSGATLPPLAKPAPPSPDLPSVPPSAAPMSLAPPSSLCQPQTLRRDGERPLKFSGMLLLSATRWRPVASGCERQMTCLDTVALFLTDQGELVLSLGIDAETHGIALYSANVVSSPAELEAALAGSESLEHRWFGTITSTSGAELARMLLKCNCPQHDEAKPLDWSKRQQTHEPQNGDLQYAS